MEDFFLILWPMQKTLTLHSQQFDPQELKVGTHEYFGQTVETTPIRTTFALCYKVESKSKFDDDTAMIFLVYDNWRKGIDDAIDKLKRVKLYVTANNTWQGVIYGKWPNTKNPLKVIGTFLKNSNNLYNMPIEVTERSHLKGYGNYSECVDQNESIGQSCKSIFHPNSYKYGNKFVLKQLSLLHETCLKIFLHFQSILPTS